MHSFPSKFTLTHLDSHKLTHKDTQTPSIHFHTHIHHSLSLALTKTHTNTHTHTQTHIHTQVFLKQIKNDGSDENQLAPRVPTFQDYLFYLLAWAPSALLPGLHQCTLGNRWEGLTYLFTANWCYVGWVLDLFDTRVLVQRAVEEHGHVECFCSLLCSSLCCCCCKRRTNPNLNSFSTNP